MKRIAGNILAIVSTFGIILWLMTDLRGGMFIYLLSYGIIILPIIIIYLISLIQTIISLIKRGLEGSKVNLFAHSLVILFIIGLCIYNSELFKSEKILSASMKDDLFYYTLIFRKDNSCEMDIDGMFGYQDKIRGNYYAKGDTIIFTKVPYSNDRFIPDTVLIDRGLKEIFIVRDSLGNFNRKKNYSGHFIIIE